ncbi:hypothetical protein ATF69_0556 [Acidovorax delafieldii]|uniref:Helix-turn-helix protein n=1 Tax=Acidovorax delafieldii TaxID=47920 RepID=A0A561XRF4_ACIDE|nr:hypothetical protein [Acidovorax delafieldii]TWG38694.1 hypothetical protein ATF69_0556 [Acidovorax delafieldii]
MANARNANRRKGNAAHRDAGGFIALPWAVIDSPAFAALSMHARALLLEVARQYVRDNNGRLLLTRERMAARGWKSNDMLTKARRELEAAGFLYQTVKGHRPNRASWFAVTWAPLDVHPGFDPEALPNFTRSAYKNASLRPPHGVESKAIAPSHGVERTATAPSHGAMKGSFQGSPTPPHGHLLEKPSTDSKWNAPATQQAAHESLTGIWLAIGGTSERLWHVGATCSAIGVGPAPHCTKMQKQQRAKAALLNAVQRHVRRKQNLTKPHKATAVRKGDNGLTRERDEHAHDTSAWAD